MEMNEAIAELKKSNEALRETITARFSSVDAEAKKAEKAALVEDVLKGLADAGLRPPENRKMVWGTPEAKAAGEKTVSFSQFMKAVARKDSDFINAIKAPTGNSETAADGGYTVPTEYANQIIALERITGVARNICKVFPMGSVTRLVPRELAKPAVYWTAEGVEPTFSKPTLAQVTQTAKKLFAIVTMTEELLEDNTAGFDAFVAQTVATEMSREEDKQAFVGDVSGLSDPFNGVYFAAGVNSVSLAGANLEYTDLVNLMFAPNASYRGRSQFVLSTTALRKVMLMVDDSKRPIWTMPIDGAPGRILGKPYNESDNIPDTLGTTRTNGTNTAILFGAWDGVWISPVGGYTVKASDSASNAAGASAFSKDEVWYKFRRRENIVVANPEAMAKMAVPAA